MNILPVLKLCPFLLCLCLFLVKPALYAGTWEATDRALDSEAVCKCMSSLRDLTLVTAKQEELKFMGEIGKISASQTGLPKAATERVAALMRNLFGGEFAVVTAKKNRAIALAEAQKQDGDAVSWMKPNAFGRPTSETNAHNAVEKAKALRSGSAQQLFNSREKLSDAAKSVNEALDDFKLADKTELVEMMTKVTKDVLGRALDRSTLDEQENQEFNRQLMAGLQVASALLGR